MTTKEDMMEFQLKKRGIHDPAVLQAMWEVDRALFVPDDVKAQAYEDRPLPIGRDQTISQPYMVAYMAQELRLSKSDIVLEIGSGCGYNAAILSKLASHIFSLEIIEWLVAFAEENLTKAGIENVTTRFTDGYQGWEEKAPFDAITLTAAPPYIPEPLKMQLKVGGRLLAPIGSSSQHLVLLEKFSEEEFKETRLLPVSFVPMTGKAQQ